MTLPAFCQDYRVIAIDHIGHGRSDKPEIPYKITDFVDYLEAFLSALGLKHVDLVGSSLGGWIAARLALRRPDLVNRLVLVGSAGLQPWPELREKLENTKFAPRTTQEVKTFLSMCFYDKVRYTNQFSVLVSYLIRSLDDSYGTIEKVLESALDPNEWLDGKLAEIRAKTLVLWGQEDELMPVEFANQFANHIPNAELEILNQCGHVPQIERAKDFNLILKNFFK
jgi:2-hydroxy-6-oxonona-2,4-dienedioate hydrolase